MVERSRSFPIQLTVAGTSIHRPRQGGHPRIGIRRTDRSSQMQIGNEQTVWMNENHLGCGMTGQSGSESHFGLPLAVGGSEGNAQMGIGSWRLLPLYHAGNEVSVAQSFIREIAYRAKSPSPPVPFCGQIPPALLSCWRFIFDIDTYSSTIMATGWTHRIGCIRVTPCVRERRR